MERGTKDRASCSLAMQSFTFYIDDDRYTLPTRLPVQLPDGVAVRERAQAMLEESDHYRGIEVFVAATSLFRINGRARLP
jgi:hypothetical protein